MQLLKFLRRIFNLLALVEQTSRDTQLLLQGQAKLMSQYDDLLTALDNETTAIAAKIS